MNDTSPKVQVGHYIKPALDMHRADINIIDTPDSSINSIVFSVDQPLYEGHINFMPFDFI